ncbi:MAG: hypothetical protein ABL869_05610 [Candidatus Nitrotoga sp.]
MEVIVKVPERKNAPSVWEHFLLKGAEAIIKLPVGNPVKMVKVADVFRGEIPDTNEWIDLVLSAAFKYNGTEYPLLKIAQRFQVVRRNNVATSLSALTWQKMTPGQSAGFVKATPPLHPLLRLSGTTVEVALEFVEITGLFNAIHGDTPWYSALHLLKGTNRQIHVLAALQGHPFVWYVVVPQSVADKKELQPNLLIYPADYGGIHYVANSLEGITTPNHNTSVGNIQCGGETLFSFLTKPISDKDYEDKLEEYLRQTNRFKNRSGRKPPPLHHLREVLGYGLTGSLPVPKYWDIPFGFEQGLSDKQQILIVPQISGGDGGICIKKGLKALVENAIFFVYTHSNTLHYDEISVNKLILTCYSESGGNIFTASKSNLSDIKAIICFEPQYMNEHLSGKDRNGNPWTENRNLSLGKEVIPLLLEKNSKVVLIGRHKHGWEAKYLPKGVNPASLVLLPNDANYGILDYPEPSKSYNLAASPVLVRRYSRLLKPTADNVVNKIRSGETEPIDYASTGKEAQVDDFIAKQRKDGLTDEQLIKKVFTPSYNDDTSGGYYTHNFIVSCGQELESGGTILKFFHHALNLA